MKFLFLGYGAITHDVLNYLASEIGSGSAEVLGAIVRGDTDRDAKIPLFPADRLPGLLDEADLVVECAGVAAAQEHGPTVIAANKPLLLTSVGALADSAVARLLLAGPGRLIVTNGAIGGFDALEATAMAAGFTEVSIQTSKHAPTLVQSWMDNTDRQQLESLCDGDEEVVFSGSPREAIEKFPGNVNVAVALAWITRDRVFSNTSSVAERVEAEAHSLEASLDRVQIDLVARGSEDPSSHVIRASRPAGSYEFCLQSSASQANPRSSALTAMSVTRDIREYSTD